MILHSWVTIFKLVTGMLVFNLLPTVLEGACVPSRTYLVTIKKRRLIFFIIIRKVDTLAWQGHICQKGFSEFSFPFCCCGC
jgi:hypothetical protein